MSSTPRLIGTLIVVVLRAKNLPNKRTIGKQDPFCTLIFNNDTKKTKVSLRGGQHPEWDEEIRFELYEDIEDELARLRQGLSTPPNHKDVKIKGGKSMRLLCHADSRKPELIGEAFVDMSTALNKGELDEWYTLINKDKYSGEIYLETTFWANDQSPQRRLTDSLSNLYPHHGGSRSVTLPDGHGPDLYQQWKSDSAMEVGDVSHLQQNYQPPVQQMRQAGYGNSTPVKPNPIRQPLAVGNPPPSSSSYAAYYESTQSAQYTDNIYQENLTPVTSGSASRKPAENVKSNPENRPTELAFPPRIVNTVRARPDIGPPPVPVPHIAQAPSFVNYGDLVRDRNKHDRPQPQYEAMVYQHHPAGVPPRVAGPPLYLHPIERSPGPPYSASIDGTRPETVGGYRQASLVSSGRELRRKLPTHPYQKQGQTLPVPGRPTPPRRVPFRQGRDTGQEINIHSPPPHVDDHNAKVEDFTGDVPSHSAVSNTSELSPSRSIIGTGETFDSPTAQFMIDTQQDALAQSLEEMMINRAPMDLSGQVVIPDRGNPAQGGLADVHAGFWGEISVAVKILRIRKSRKADAAWDASNKRRIAREMHVWAALKHPNICEFLGYSTSFSDYPAMISMWCERGTATEYLDSQNWDVSERIRLTKDVSEGLRYLHNLKIIHGDLKPSNILVDEDYAGRLCDFGLVRLADWEGPAGLTTTSPYTGTERYKAPELFISSENRHPIATFEGDIYSFGCIILEFVEQIYPFQRFCRTQDLRSAIMDGSAPALRSGATRALSGMNDSLWDLLESCWADMSDRPKIDEVISYLTGFV